MVAFTLCLSAAPYDEMCTECDVRLMLTAQNCDAAVVVAVAVAVAVTLSDLMHQIWLFRQSVYVQSPNSTWTRQDDHTTQWPDT